MPEMHAGTVTLLFTDVEQSTDLLQRLGDDQAQVFWHAYLRLLRDAIKGSGGREVKSLGDGLMAVFSSSLDALACSVAMQQAVYQHNQQQEEDHSLQVRIGLHVGEPILEEEDYFGTPVVIAWRLCDQALGAQIIASDLVRRLVGSRGGYKFSEMKPLALKGIPEPVRACEVIWTTAAEETGELPPLPPLLANIERSAFVGREKELATLRKHWARVRAGESRFVLLTGDAGIGKTRLAAEFAFTAHAERATILYGGTEENAVLPYQPFVEAIRQYASQRRREEFTFETRPIEDAEALTELSRRLADSSKVPAAGTDSDRYRTFSALVEAMVSMCRRQPVILMLDDLHWAGEETISLLKYLVRSIKQSPLLVIGTSRYSELERKHPLTKALAELQRDRSFQRIPLGGLDEQGVGALIGAWVGRESPAAFQNAFSFISALHDQTEGNPFFIEEVLRHLAEIGAIHARDDRWIINKAASESAIPEGVKDVIAKRLTRLSEECNSILTVASVIGREFGLDRLKRASDVSDERLLELLEEAVTARILSEVPHIVGRYSFSHALIYETLYDELTTTRRVHLHGQTLQYADSDGVKLAYEILGGSGPYMIAVGLSNCAVARAMHHSIANRWDHFCKFCRVLLYDRRGVGFSSAPERGYSVRAGIEDMRAVLDAAGIKKVFVWGATDGGPMAITFAAHYPERVSGLILAGTTAKYINSDDFAFGVNPAELESFRRTDSSDTGRAVARLTRTRSSADRADAIGEVMRRIPAEAWLKIMGSIGSGDARTLLSKIQVPTLIIHDPDNTYIPVEAAHHLHEKIPESTLEITEEYGPALYGRNLFRTIEGFMEEVSRQGSPRL